MICSGELIADRIECRVPKVKLRWPIADRLYHHLEILIPVGQRIANAPGRMSAGCSRALAAT